MAREVLNAYYVSNIEVAETAAVSPVISTREDTPLTVPSGSQQDTGGDPSLPALGIREDRYISVRPHPKRRPLTRKCVTLAEYDRRKASRASVSNVEPQAEPISQGQPKVIHSMDDSDCSIAEVSE